MIELEKLTEFAKKVRIGFSNGRPSEKVMGFKRAEIQFLYRKMKKDKYEGLLPFYVSHLCLKYLLCTFEKKKLREKISDFDLINSAKIDEASRVAHFDFANLIGSFKKYLEQDSNVELNEDICYCATIAIILGMGKAENFDRDVFYLLLNFLDV